MVLVEFALCNAEHTATLQNLGKSWGMCGKRCNPQPAQQNWAEHVKECLTELMIVSACGPKHKFIDAPAAVGLPLERGRPRKMQCLPALII